jgi:hypothetical protein
MKNKMIKILPLLSLTLMVACGISDSTPKGPELSQNEVVQEDGSNIDGVYAAEVWPVNYNLHFKKLGMIGIKRQGDEFSASIRLKYAPKDTVLKASLYTGRRCPNIKDDLNKDAYIDIREANIVIGKVTIPIDGDLNSQMGGFSQSYRSDIDGRFFYENSASFDRLFSDLKSPGENLQHNMIKLKEDEGLTLPGRIVIIQGLTPKVSLPETVDTVNGESAYESIPIACGVLWKVPEMPAELSPEAELNY